MGFEERTPDLLVLLTAYARGSSSAVSIPPRPPTPAVTAEAVNKKCKQGQGGKGAEVAEEGEIFEPPVKEACRAKGSRGRAPKTLGP
nr:hypothetical protein CFP56_22092 [Quercus suber]